MTELFMLNGSGVKTSAVSFEYVDSGATGTREYTSSLGFNMAGLLLEIF